MFYGWGKKSKDWAMPDGRTLICSYSYVSLMFVFKFVWSRKWHLIGRDRAMDMETNREDLERMYGAGNVPDIGLFERFGMFITGGVIVALMLASAGVQTIFGSGGTSSVETASLAGEPVAVVVDSDEDSTDALESSDSETALGSETAAGDETTSSENAAQGTDPDDSMAANSGGTDSDDSDSSESGSNSTDSGKLAAIDPGSDETDSDGASNSTGNIYEEADVPEANDGQSFVSTNPDLPTQGWSDMTLHRVYATSIVGEQQADPGEKYLVVEYQVLGVASFANFFSSTFRLDVDGALYSPSLSRINEVVDAGGVINSDVIFTVPADVVDLRIEAGALDPDGDGYQASWNMSLSAAEPPAEPVRFSGPDQAGSWKQLSDLNEFTGYPISPQQPPLEIELLEVGAVAKIGPDAAEPGFKFIVVEAQVRGKSGVANFQTNAFRLLAEGELYPALTRINEALGAGDVWSGPVVFQVPSETVIADLEVGTPVTFETGHWAFFEISFE